MKKFKSPRKRRNQSGQALVEYALVLALVTVVAISMLKAIGQNVQSQLSAVNSSLATATGG
jgi:Flp pilus assembly pilin Flp